MIRLLFQMCYGPEIKSIYNTILKKPDITLVELRDLFQFDTSSDITSLVEGVLKFLQGVELIFVKEKRIRTKEEVEWDEILLLSKFNDITKDGIEINNLDYVFTTMHYNLFVRQNKLFVKDLHYQTNLFYENVSISQEKINAWKRMMECFGLGYRCYGGFYALPHPNLIEKLISHNTNWEGPLQQFFEEKIHPILACVHNGVIFNGVIYALLNFDGKGKIKLMKKQDLPYLAFGENRQWNWISIGGM